MGERTGYEPGTFCWLDLTTTDAEGAKAFYTGLFSWEFEDMPLPEGGAYTMLRCGGKDVCGLARGQEGQPTAWLSYVSVDDVDALAARAGELGATALVEPLDVLEAGRMAVLQDPTGAVFAVWKANRHSGAALVNGPGALTLNQLNTSDPGAATAFYRELFGWRIDQVVHDPQPYWGIYLGEALNGGLMALPPETSAPSHWLPYFGSEDVDADAGRIGELGGQLLVPPSPVPGGRMLGAQDPQGVAFALFSGRFDN